ncbi:uncharacterized protein LOC142339145 [Convolutriloba macropyga]|uniref:uncharacterized protein LOC142339145 n=1 Tax=Convolutriloba macropyga TaxID=536237 RepID=UPI003F52800F
MTQMPSFPFLPDNDSCRLVLKRPSNQRHQFFIRISTTSTLKRQVAIRPSPNATILPTNRFQPEKSVCLKSVLDKWKTFCAKGIVDPEQSHPICRTLYIPLVSMWRTKYSGYSVPQSISGRSDKGHAGQQVPVGSVRQTRQNYSLCSLKI